MLPSKTTWFLIILLSLFYLPKAVYSLSSHSVNATMDLWVKFDVDYSALNISSWMKVELFGNEMPITVKNFASLCLSNHTTPCKSYY